MGSERRGRWRNPFRVAISPQSRRTDRLRALKTVFRAEVVAVIVTLAALGLAQMSVFSSPSGLVAFVILGVVAIALMAWYVSRR